MPIRIPRNFYRQWQDEVFLVVRFVDPVSNRFQIRVSSMDGKYYFQDGGEEMKNFHQIDRPIIFCLRFRGNHEFEMKIKNNNLVETEYPIVVSEENVFDPAIDNAYELQWSTELSKAQASGTQTLSIPLNMVGGVMLRSQPYITVKLAENDLEDWKLLRNSRRVNQCAIGKGWYKFCSSNNLRGGTL